MTVPVTPPEISRRLDQIALELARLAAFAPDNWHIRAAALALDRVADEWAAARQEAAR